MAAGSVLGALKVILGVDGSSLDKGLKDSKSAFSSFAKSIGTIAAGIGLERGIESAMSALVGSVKQGVEQADKLNKLSQSIGMPVDELSKLKYAADLSDVSLEALGKSTVKLSKNMTDVAGGGTGPAAQAFTALGISVKNTDGTLKSSSEVISEVAGKFEGYKDGAAKTALAVALFGKAGADMIPLLNQGADGLKQAGDEAEKFGLVLDKNTSQAAENFNDNLTRLGKVKDGIIVQITARMLPALEAFSGQMVQSAKDTELLQMVADALTNGIKFVVTEFINASAALKRFGEEVSAVWASLKNVDWLRLGPSLAKTWEVMQVEGQKTVAVMGEVKKTVSDIWSDVPTWDSQASGIASMNKQVNLLGAEWGKVAAPIIQSGEATKNALQTYLDSQSKRTASQTAEAQTIGKSVGEQAKLRVELEAQAIATSKNIALTPTLLAQIAATGDAAALSAMKVAGANVTLQAQNPAQQYQLQMTQLQALYDAGAISLETFGARQQQIAEAAGATWDIAGASIAGSFATISGAFGKESSAMATAAKVFGVIQGTISMFTGAAKALELPFPANIAAVAAVLAKGASLVASIKSTAVPTGMMTGGSLMVRGGGGPDSVPVNMNLSPGEQVDVWRPDQGGGADPRRGAGGGSKTVVLNGFMWGRDQIRDLVDALNEGNRDGIKLVFS